MSCSNRHCLNERQAVELFHKALAWCKYEDDEDDTVIRQGGYNPAEEDISEHEDGQGAGGIESPDNDEPRRSVRHRRENTRYFNDDFDNT